MPGRHRAGDIRPGQPRYQHYLSTAQVAAEFGCTSAQQAAVSGWLSKSALTVTHRDSFTVDAGNVINGKAKRAVPEVSDLGDFTVGYQIGFSYIGRHHKLIYVNVVNGGTSLSSPMFTGFEADLIQGRHHIALGFANPALYNMANTGAYHDVTSKPQGQGYTEAAVFGSAYGLPPTLTTMGLCATTPTHQTCGAGYDTTSGIGSPGPSFFSSFGSHPAH